jgi:Cysteine-rich secretory protein family
LGKPIGSLGYSSFSRVRILLHHTKTGEDMAIPKLRILVAALLIALCSSTTLFAQALSDSEAAGVVADHNAVRQSVAQAESVRLGGTVSIPDLTWDVSPATVAQQWAELLVNQDPPKICHRCGNNACNPPLVANQCHPDLGENIYQAWSAGIPDKSASTAVKSWADEKQDYNFDQNTCASGKVCGHYTQVVWSSTQRLGCGRATRTTADGRTYVTWVCNYAPPGNVSGQRPYSVAGAPPPAEGTGTNRHFVEVNFTKIRVHNCNELGICAWRLFCRLGSQPETLLLDNVEADDRDEPPISRALTQDGTLPVTVTCKLEERDAPIYEHLGTLSLTIQSGGVNTIRIMHVDEDGDIDEGDVSIFMDVQSKVQQGATAQPPPAAPTTQPRRDVLVALRAVGIDFSVSEVSMRSWLSNNFTPYPALASTLLRLLEGKRLRQPVYLDVISWNYEHSPGASSPRSEIDVDLAVLRTAVVDGHNERYGEAVTDFEKLVDVFTVATNAAQPVAESGMGFGCVKMFCR